MSLCYAHFEKVTGLTHYRSDPQNIPILCLKPHAESWADENLGYTPQLLINLKRSPDECLLRFQNEEDAVLFYLRFADNWQSELRLR